MKTPLCFLAAFVAFFVLPIDFTAMLSAFFAAGLIALAVADYRRKYRPIGQCASLAGLTPYEQFQLAA